MISAVRSEGGFDMSTDPGRQEPHHKTQAQVRVDPRHRIVGHDAQAAVETLEALSAGYGLMTSSTRNSTNPASAPDHPTGMKASVTSMPRTSSITTGPGSVPPK